MTYNLIPLNQRALFHLEIGRELWRQIKSFDLESNIFVALTQVNLGKRLITREKERYAVAGLCLYAGQKAALSSAFSTSLVYLDLAIDLLDESAWEKQYDRTLAVYSAACETEMCTANFEKMEDHVQTVLRHARNICDKLQAYSSKSTPLVFPVTRAMPLSPQVRF